MRFNHSKKIIVLLAVILSIALHANIRHLKEEVTIYRSGNTHEISLLEKRLSTLKKELPPDGKIGLITDERSKYFPYVLAPLIIVDYRKAQLVVAISSNTPVNTEYYKKRGLLLVKDFGNGVRLLKRKAE